jgi:predicted AAA+ superfamily ATPase
MQYVHDIKRSFEGILQKASKSILLLGPRQVGKSTLLSKMKVDLSIDLADEATYLDFSSNPSLIKERLAETQAKTIVIDEVQRLPSLLNTIQFLVDKDKSLKFFLSGSSARKLKRGKANLLPGRVFNYELGPLAASELGYKLDVKRALKFETLPEPYLNAND